MYFFDFFKCRLLVFLSHVVKVAPEDTHASIYEEGKTIILLDSYLFYILYQAWGPLKRMAFQHLKGI